eukprot:TRINITY_DN7504_c0_g1_i2.p1 TRINITY_DN7504_c0_g1~~TRINITY_DN7504_c0_g1_i2.p1  ORF type:complete len:784 (-),score=123.85 TRINITY_DN7504_c0_g1_i2:83-2434(-)
MKGSLTTYLFLVLLLFCLPVIYTREYEFYETNLKHEEHYRQNREIKTLGPTKDRNFTVEQIRSMAEKFMQCNNVPGISMGLYLDGEEFTIYLGTEDGQNPVTLDTNFMIGSISKSFTAFLAGIFVDKGLLEWHKFIEENLDMLDCLTHRSGYGLHAYDGIWAWGTDMDRLALVKSISSMKPSLKLRQQMAYNNVIYVLAGYVLEVISGETWESLVQKYIFDPVGMTHSYTGVAEALKYGRLAHPYVSVMDTVDRYISNFSVDAILDLVGPSGSLSSTAEDMLKWMKVLLNDGKLPNGTELISLSTFEYLRSPLTSTYPRVDHFEIVSPLTNNSLASIYSDAYGGGWVLESYRQRRSFWHNGAFCGFNAQFSMYPLDNAGIIIQSNTDNIARPYLLALARYLMDMWYYGNSWLDEGYFWGNWSTNSQQQKTYKQEYNNNNSTDIIEKFVGDYSHPYFGSITVSLNASGGFMQFQKLRGPLIPSSEDTFLWDAVAEDLPKGASCGPLRPFEVTFVVNSLGFASRCTVLFDDPPAVEFLRPLDKELLFFMGLLGALPAVVLSLLLLLYQLIKGSKHDRTSYSYIEIEEIQVTDLPIEDSSKVLWSYRPFKRFMYANLVRICISLVFASLALCLSLISWYYFNMDHTIQITMILCCTFLLLWLIFFAVSVFYLKPPGLLFLLTADHAVVLYKPRFRCGLHEPITQQYDLDVFKPNFLLKDGHVHFGPMGMRGKLIHAFPLGAELFGYHRHFCNVPNVGEVFDKVYANKAYGTTTDVVHAAELTEDDP